MRTFPTLHRFRLIVILLSLVCAERGWALADGRAVPAPEQIADEVRQIEGATNRHATDEELGRLWSQLASDYQNAASVQSAEDAYAHALKLLRGTSSTQGLYAATLNGLGSLYLETERIAEAESCVRKALAIVEAMGDRRSAGAFHGHLAVSLMNEARYREAEEEASAALDGLQAPKGKDVGEVVSALIARSYARCLQHRCKDGLDDVRAAQGLIRAGFRADSIEAAATWKALGYMLWKTGDNTGGGEAMLEAVRIVRGRDDLPQAMVVNALLGTLTLYVQFLNATHQKAEVRRVEEEMTRLREKEKKATSCNGCTVSVVGLATGLR